MLSGFIDVTLAALAIPAEQAAIANAENNSRLLRI